MFRRQLFSKHCNRDKVIINSALLISFKTPKAYLALINFILYRELLSYTNTVSLYIFPELPGRFKYVINNFD